MTAPHQPDLRAAADLLGISEDATAELVAAGFLGGVTDAGGTHVTTSDVKAFIARNSALDASVPTDLEALFESLPTDPDDLLGLVSARRHEMAERAFEVFATTFDGASTWPEARRQRFIEQAVDRFDAILAVAGRRERLDDSVLADLTDVGRSAARSGASLPEVLLTLRISRDLVVQTAVAAADEHEGHGSLALSILLTRVLPALDRLTDAVGRGYWAEVVQREEEGWARYEYVVDHSSDGIYEVDEHGTIIYANPSLSAILGLTSRSLEGRSLSDVLIPADARQASQVLGAAPDGGWRDVRILRADGVVRQVEMRVEPRMHQGEQVGFDGVVRDVTTERTLEQRKNDFLATMTHELRQPVTTILGLGITLNTYASELDPKRVAHVGASIHAQAERLARLADDLYDISQIEANELRVDRERVDVTAAVDGALAMLSDSDGVRVDLEPDLLALADRRRLEQIVAHLVENGLTHGSAPVDVIGARDGRAVEIRIADHGDGVDPELVDTLFDRLHGGDGNGIGLSLANALVEAMGGRLSLEHGPEGGAVFVVNLLAA